MHLALIIDDYLPHSTRVAAKMFHELAKQFVVMGASGDSDYTSRRSKISVRNFRV